MIKAKHGFLFFATAIFIIKFFAGCGLEEYAYIDSIPQSNIDQSVFNKATVRIPSSFAGSGMSGFHFIVFYRIYISEVLKEPQGYTTNPDYEYGSINSVLVSDYKYFKTKIENNSNEDMFKLFHNRGYKNLCLEDDEDIDAILNNSVLGQNIAFEFPDVLSSSQYPKMTINGVSHNLFRSTDGGEYRALPNRYFLCRPNFWSSKLITGDGRIDSTTNADIVDKENIEEKRDFAYTAMYIVAAATDDTTFTSVYGTPAIVRIFKLTQNN